MKPKLPQVSLVIPVKDRFQSLFLCLTSLNQQSDQDFEVIVVVNGWTSDRRLPPLPSAIATMNLRWLFHAKANIGSARNYGIAQAMGQLVISTDSDCTFAPYWIERYVTFLKVHPEVRIAVGPEIIPHGRHWARVHSQLNRRHFFSKVNGKIISHLDTNNCVVRSDLAKEIRFDEGLSAAQDFELFCQLTKRNIKVHYVDNPVYHHCKWRIRDILLSKWRQSFSIGRIWSRYQHTPSRELNEFQYLMPIRMMRFYPYLVTILWRDGFEVFLFESLTGIVWQAGLLTGFIRQYGKNRLTDICKLLCIIRKRFA